MAHVPLSARERTQLGNGPSRRLRREGHVPGIIYRPGDDSLPLSIDGRELRRALAAGGSFGVIDLTVADSRPRPVLVKEWQLDPVRGQVVHIDFQEVDLTQETHAEAGVSLVGQAAGVREGGVLDQPLRDVEVAALPDALPEYIEYDVSLLEIGDSVTVADLVAPPGVTILSDPETVVASVVAPTVEEEAPEEDEALEDEAAETAAEDDADE